MIIEIDDREPDFIRDFFREMATILYAGDLPVNIIVKRLPVGDWKIIDDDGRGLRTLVVERKHIDRKTGSNDMIASRNDGRWDAQNDLIEDVDENEDVLFALTGYWGEDAIECDYCHRTHGVFSCKQCGSDIYLTRVRMEPKDRKSIITHMAGMNKRGILSLSFPTDKDLIYHSLKYFEMREDYVRIRKMSVKYDKTLEFTARIFSQKGISNETAIGVAKYIAKPDDIGKLTAEMLSHLIRKVQEKEDREMPLEVALQFFFNWHGLEPVDVKLYREMMGMDKHSCRYCTGKGKMYENGFIDCSFCGSTGLKQKKTDNVAGSQR